jgi:hypothetical protein
MLSQQNKRILNQLYKSDLTRYENLELLFQTARNISTIDGELDEALSICQKVKVKAASLTKLDIRFFDLYYKCLLFRAPHYFDDFLLYIEKDRDAKSRFYLPRRRQLLKLGLIQALQELETGELETLSLSLPPGTGKTTLGEFFIAWVVGRDPEKYNLFVSHSGDITRMFYDAINNITSSGEYLWHDVFPSVMKESENAKIEQINFGKFKPFKSVQCTSVGSKNAGKVRCNGYLYCDDLIGGIEEALSKPRLDKLWTTYSVDLRQRKKDGCKEIHVATRWSVHDVIGRLQMKFGKSDKARFIAIPDIDPETDKSNFDYDYGVGYSEDYFHDQEDTMDDISYKCLYKSEPIEREGLLYHENDIRRYLNIPARQPDAILGICDTKDKGTDFLFLPVMLQYGDDYYCVDCVCDDNSDYGIQYDNCSKIIINHEMQQCQFESNNGGSRVAYEVNKLVEQGGGRCNITSQVTTSNKETKIIVNADWVKKHVLFKDESLYNPKDHYGVMMSFLLSYSVKGKNPHDDVPDGFAQFALFATNMYGTKASVVDRRSLGL